MAFLNVLDGHALEDPVENRSALAALLAQSPRALAPKRASREAVRDSQRSHPWLSGWHRSPCLIEEEEKSWGG